MVRVESPVRQYLKELIQLGVSHHVIVVHGDVAADLELVADVLGIQKHVLL
jgi:hypothetical protein